jgi:hypothetical protein
VINVIVPHFNQYKLEGNKQKNLLIWKEIVSLVNSKAHLTPEGMVKIKELKDKLNK